MASLRNRFFALSGEVIKAFTSFDGIQIAYHDQGEGRAVILLHGGFVDGLGQFGEFERILPILERRQEMFRSCLAERFRFLILHSKEGRVWPGPYWRQGPGSSCQTLDLA